MGKLRYLTKKHLSVIDDMFGGQFDEQQLMERHNLRKETFKRWQSAEVFVEEVTRRIKAAQLQCAAFIAGYSQVAAANLVQLTESKNPETARKACLDIIGFEFTKESQNRGSSSKVTAEEGSEVNEHRGDDEHFGQQLSLEVAGRLLAALAAEEKGEQ